MIDTEADFEHYVRSLLFICQERAQYRAEAHDMEVSEQWK